MLGEIIALLTIALPSAISIIIRTKPETNHSSIPFRYIQRVLRVGLDLYTFPNNTLRRVKGVPVHYPESRIILPQAFAISITLITF